MASIKFGSVFRNVVDDKPNMNDFSMVTVSSPLQLFDKIMFGKCVAEFPLDLVSSGDHFDSTANDTFRLQVDEDDDQLCEAVKGFDPAEALLTVDICRDKATVDEDAMSLILAVANDPSTPRAKQIESAVRLIRGRHPSPTRMVQYELDGRIICAKVGTFVMPCCSEYRGFACLNTNDVCVVSIEE